MNRFFIAMQGERITFMKPLPQSFSVEDAVELGAWLVTMADPFVKNEAKKFKARVKEIQES